MNWPEPAMPKPLCEVGEACGKEDDPRRLPRVVWLGLFTLTGLQ